MKFGLFLPFHWFDMQRPVSEVYENALELAVTADELGFDVVWIAEHHFINFIACPSPFIFATQIAQQTRRIRIGTAVAVLPFYHPLRAIGDAAVADIVSGGRLELGVGRGAFPYEFHRYGVDVNSSKSTFYEAVEIMRRMWASDQAISHHGKHWSFEDAKVIPPPLQKPHPPIWIAGQTTDTVQWAASERLHVLNSPWRDAFSRVEEVSAAHSAALQQHGVSREESRLGISRMAFVGETDADVRRQIEHIRFNHAMLLHLHHGTAEVVNGEVQTKSVAELHADNGSADGGAANGERHRFGWQTASSEYSGEEIYQNLIFGTPERVRSLVQQYVDLNIDHLMLYMAFGERHEDALRSVQLFGTEVMPHFKEQSRLATATV